MFCRHMLWLGWNQLQEVHRMKITPSHETSFDFVKSLNFHCRSVLDSSLCRSHVDRRKVIAPVSRLDVSLAALKVAVAHCASDRLVFMSREEAFFAPFAGLKWKLASLRVCLRALTKNGFCIPCWLVIRSTILIIVCELWRFVLTSVKAATRLKFVNLHN